SSRPCPMVRAWRGNPFSAPIAGGNLGEKDTRPVTATETSEPSRRDFLYIATGAAGAVGVAGVAWPFIDQLRPDASTLALASIDVDVSGVDPGMSVTVKWRGKPVFIRNRTEAEVEEAQAVALEDLKD